MRSIFYVNLVSFCSLLGFTVFLMKEKTKKLINFNNCYHGALHNCHLGVVAAADSSIRVDLFYTFGLGAFLNSDDICCLYSHRVKDK